MSGDSWFQPKQDRARPTVEALINAAIDELREHGPSGLRQDRVLAASGVAQGSLYHHFGNRDGLIDAAYATVFTRATNRVMERVRTALERASSVEDLTAELVEIIDYLIGPEYDGPRHDAVAVLAMAATRPSLASLVEAAQRQIAADMAEIITELQRFGILRPELDPLAVALFIRSFTLGQVVLSVDSSPPSAETWHTTVFTALSGFHTRAHNGGLSIE
jgi:AcrR family transcriptional regulator